MHAFFENNEYNFVVFKTSGLSFPVHLHQQLEIFYVISGETRVTVRRETKVLKAGDIAIIFPNHIHSYSCLSDECHGALLICDLSHTGGYMETLMRNHPSNPFLDGSDLHQNVVYAINQLIEECENQRDSSVYGPLTQLILARLLPELSLHRNRSEDYEEISYKITQYINMNFKDSIKLEMLAKALGISKYRLSHLFSEKMGQNFTSYLSSIRVSYARSRLAESDKTVTEIAEESGFESQRSFFRTFAAHYGMTPLEYRNKYRGKGKLTIGGN